MVSRRGEGKTDDQVRKVDWTAGNAVDLERIKRRDNVAGDAADGYGFPGTDDEVGQQHDPSGGEADVAGESGRSVGDLTCGVWHCGDQSAVDPADGEKQSAAHGETQQSAESATA